MRLSGDLDFTGGSSFERSDLAALGRVLVDRLEARHGLPVKVSDPVKTGSQVSTWKLTVETRPGRKDQPAQRIDLDICAIPSHAPRPMMLRNLYGIDLGTSGLILQAKSGQADQEHQVSLQSDGPGVERRTAGLYSPATEAVLTAAGPPISCPIAHSPPKG